MTELFPDIPLTKIDRINLQRQEPGKRGPGSLVHQALPSYTDAEELIGLCEDIGPGRYKAIALDDRGKPLGPAWSWEIAAPTVEGVEQTILPVQRSAATLPEEELRELRNMHRDELDELRAHLSERHDDELARERETAEHRADARVEMAELDATRRVRDAERRLEDMERRATQDQQRAHDELERAQMRLERLQGELDTRSRELLAARERIHEIERSGMEQQLSYSKRISELEEQAKASLRVHEADLRELRNGSPEMLSAIAQTNADWEIRRGELLLNADLLDRARENGTGAKLLEMLQKDETQELLLPMLNSVLERLFAPPDSPENKLTNS